MTARVGLAGLDFDVVTEPDTVRLVIDSLEAGHGGWVMPVNLEVLRLTTRSASDHELVTGADVVVADGQPLVWASRLQGTPLPDRVSGSNLIWSLTEGAARAGRSIFLLGGDPGAAEEAAERLTTRNPGLRVAGLYCPPFGFEHDSDERARIVETVRAAAPDVVFVGLGFPKQEQVIGELRPHLPGAWFMSVGISINFVAGYVQRAPRWMHGLGIEWLHRLAQEPRRLTRRYLLHGLPFAARLLAGSARARTRRAAVSR
jgi:N-acetylglucosaminyldiphosphoundecaprenol N-acetyl-beta-D-mannosaminyltransferase